MVQNLVSHLVSQLGVKEDQAKGGAGALFKLAKDQMGAGDFSQLSEKMGGLDDLVKAAPSMTSGMGGIMGSIASAVGANKLGGLAMAATAFKSLNMDAGMVTKFIPSILEFVQTQGGDSLKGMLAGALGSLGKD